MKAGGAVDGDQRAIGIEMNGHVWNGDKWMPIPPRPASSGRQHIPALGGSAVPPVPMWQQRGPQGGFSDPHYGYGLTRQTSDDLQFIARFIKVMIIIWIVLTILGIITIPLFFGSLMAATSGLVPHAAR